MATKHAVHFSSDRIDWATPPEIFDPLHAEFGFTLDVCASKSNTKCKKYYDILDDALSKQWKGVCWMNPPYAKGVTGHWVRKAYVQAICNDATIVCLLPARTDQRWWHVYCMANNAEIRWIKGRVTFEGAESGAPFPSVIVIFRPL